MKRSILLAAIIVSGIQFTHAQTAMSQINHRQRNEQRRIKQGERTGELTKWESRKLEREQREIRRDKRYARADGKLTTTERREIKREQGKAGRDIYHKKHNGRETFSR